MTCVHMLYGTSGYIIYINKVYTRYTMSQHSMRNKKVEDLSINLSTYSFHYMCATRTPLPSKSVHYHRRYTRNRYHCNSET